MKNENTESKQEQRTPRAAIGEGHHLALPILESLGITVYVPSANELRAQTGVIRPFAGRILNKEYGFRCASDVGTALMHMIANFGLPNAPEYLNWSERFMDFGRETTYWEYIFLVNGTHYLFVSHDAGKLVVGSKGITDDRTGEAFSRFIEMTVDLSVEIAARDN